MNSFFSITMIQNASHLYGHCGKHKNIPTYLLNEHIEEQILVKNDLKTI